jgi:hypothetical protein
MPAATTGRMLMAMRLNKRNSAIFRYGNITQKGDWR